MRRSLACVALAVCLASFMSGCAGKRIPFTHGIVTSYNLSHDDIKNLQFYVSDTVTLQREVQKGEDESGVTSGHTLRMVRDKKVEEVKIKSNTPGIATYVYVDNYVITVSFEEGNSLEFGNSARTSSGTYRLFADWKVGLGNVGKVQYESKSFDAVEDSASAHLMIDFNALNKFKKESRTVKGRKLK